MYLKQICYEKCQPAEVTLVYMTKLVLMHHMLKAKIQKVCMLFSHSVLMVIPARNFKDKWEVEVVCHCLTPWSLAWRLTKIHLHISDSTYWPIHWSIWRLKGKGSKELIYDVTPRVPVGDSMPSAAATRPSTALRLLNFQNWAQCNSWAATPLEIR